MAKAKIKVRIENGTVREVAGIPEHYTVRILDYDVEKYGADELSKDENQKSRRVTEWPARKRAAC